MLRHERRCDQGAPDERQDAPVQGRFRLHQTSHGQRRTIRLLQGLWYVLGEGTMTFIITTGTKLTGYCAAWDTYDLDVPYL